MIVALANILAKMCNSWRLKREHQSLFSIVAPFLFTEKVQKFLRYWNIFLKIAEKLYYLVDNAYCIDIDIHSTNWSRESSKTNVILMNTLMNFVPLPFKYGLWANDGCLWRWLNHMAMAIFINCNVLDIEFRILNTKGTVFFREIAKI